MYTNKILITIMFLFIFFCRISAQSTNKSVVKSNQKIDSLNKALGKAKHDTTIASIYIAISGEFVMSKKDTMIFLASKALDILEKLPTDQKQFKNVKYLTGSALINLGSGNHSLGKASIALEHFKRGLQLFEEIDEKKGAAIILNNIGLIHSLQGEYSTAIDYYLKCLKLNEYSKYQEGIATALNNIGFIYFQQGDYLKAIEYYNRGLAVGREAKNDKAIGQSISSLGVIHVKLGDIQKGKDYYLQGYELAEKTGNKAEMGIILNNIGALYKDQGDVPKAIDYYLKAQKLKEEIKDKRGMSLIYHNIGGVYLDWGNYGKALEYYKKSLALRQELKDKSGIATTINNIGITYKSMGKFENALEEFEKSIKIKEELGDKRGLGISFMSKGSVLRNKGDFVKALEYYDKAIKIMEEIGEKKEIVTGLNSKSNTLRRFKKYEEAKQVSRRALKLSEDLGFPHELKNANFSLFESYALNKQPDSAYPHLIKLIDLLQRSIKTSYFTLSEKEKDLFFVNAEDDYMYFYNFCSSYSKNKPFLCDSAYNIALANKSLSLKSSTAMRKIILGSGDSSLIRLYEEWISLKIKIVKGYNAAKDIKGIEQKADEMEKELAKKTNAFDDFEKIKGLNWKQVQASLKKDEAAIEFIHFKDRMDSSNATRYSALVVKAESKHPELINLFNEKDLIKILGEKTGTGESYITKVYGKQNDVETRLYDLIWRPMEKSLKDIKIVYYSPSGLLHRISFAALRKNKNIYLCDNHKMELKGSTAKVTFPEATSKSDELNYGIFGGINYDTPEAQEDSTALLHWTYLDGTKTESEKIISILKSNNHKADYLTGNNATELEFKTLAPKKNVIHVATHGFFFSNPWEDAENQELEGVSTETVSSRKGEDAMGVQNFILNKNPLMRSGLVFAGANNVWVKKNLDNNEDGVLTAQEVATLDLRKTDLVILSACETGLGDIKGTEGVYGLQRSLKMAGVKNIIMSLWQVPDAETVEFMELFYKKFTSGKSISIAFNESLNYMRKKYDPFYWAAFVLME